MSRGEQDKAFSPEIQYYFRVILGRKNIMSILLLGYWPLNEGYNSSKGSSTIKSELATCELSTG